jgi:LPS-assembly protein
MQTELSFTMDKIFGLAYEEKVKAKGIKTKDKNLKVDQSMIGVLPDYEQSLTDETFIQVKNSYRHSQEFKFIHHYIANSFETGNQDFENQIQSVNGWFDYQDAILEDQADVGSNLTRTLIPRRNTLEFQWNNLLIRKSPKTFNYFQDQRFLRDNFNYNRVGYFDISQGLIIDDNLTFDERLTRLFINTGYNASDWSVSLREYYFHQDDSEITNLSFTKRFEPFNFLTAYNFNSLPGSNIKTLRLGGQFKATDVIGFTYLNDQDLDANENIMSIYHIDFMPPNNCWIINLNYRESVVDQRYSFNFVFNLGNDEYKDYRRNFYNFERVRTSR